MVVSVVMITYAHEKYIREAIAGVLMQLCSFDVELIIANDCSPDGTDLVVNEIIKSHKNATWIKYIKHEKNLGMMPNFIFAMQQAKGKYIALCEGDDYWTDPYKLQKQVDFLEANPDYVLCFHRVNILLNGHIESDEKDISEVRYQSIKDENNITIKDLLLYGNFMHTCSVVFKNIISNFPCEMAKSSVGDYILYVLLLKDGGKIKKINNFMSVYRRGVGTYSSLNEEKMLQNILIYQTCVLSVLFNEDHRQIMLDKVLNTQKQLFFKLSNYKVHEEVTVKKYLRKKLVKYKSRVFKIIGKYNEGK